MGTLHEDQYTYSFIHFWLHLTHFFLEWEVFPTKVIEKIKTHILCSITFFFIMQFMRCCGKIL